VATSPAWYAAIGLREWGVIPNSNLSTSGVMHSGGGGTIQFWGSGIINTAGIYNGAIFIPGTFLCIHGGGHGDYSGNEIYCFGPFESASPQWYLPRDRTNPAPDDVSYDANGNPVSDHIYCSIVYPGSARNIMVRPGTRYAYHSAAAPFGDIFKFNFGQVSPNVNQPWSRASATIPVGSGHNPPNLCVYDPVGDMVWMKTMSQNRMATWNPTTDVYTQQIHKSPVGSDSATCALDYNLGIMAVLSHTSGLSFFRINTLNNDFYVPSTTGTAPPTNGTPTPGNGIGSILYDETDSVFRAYAGDSARRRVYTLTPPGTNPHQGGNAWTWSNEEPSGGSTPDTQQANGTYGRYNRIGVEGIQGDILLNSATGDMYMFRTGSIVAGQSGPPKGSLSLLGVGR
jgi:hypothetical protein